MHFWMNEYMSIKHKFISFQVQTREGKMKLSRLLTTKLCEENGIPVVIQVTGMECWREFSK